MSRLIVVVGLPFLSGFLGALVALAIGFPRIADAQGGQLTGEELSLLGVNGPQRVRAVAGPDAFAGVALLSEDGTIRAQMAMGGQQQGVLGTRPEAAGFMINSSTGALLGRLGTQLNPVGEFLGTNVVLNAPDGSPRLRLFVDREGIPSIELLDAGGNVTWSVGGQ